MNLQRMLFHAAVVAALGSAAFAQSSNGSSSMGQDQQGMAQHHETQLGGESTPSSMSHDTGAKSPDHLFITKAAQGGLAEVALGNLAEQNGGSDAVKQFGNRMVTDHTKANDELRHLAEQKGITLPSNVSAKDKQIEKALESKKGQDFDRAYVRDMVKDHETDIAEFRKEAENGKDPEVKAWAQKTLPILEQHLDAAKQVAGQVGVSNAKSSGPSAMSSKQQ